MTRKSKLKRGIPGLITGLATVSLLLPAAGGGTAASAATAKGGFNWVFPTAVPSTLKSTSVSNLSNSCTMLPLGAATSFSAFTLGNFNYQNDDEDGAVAAGGNMIVSRSRLASDVSALPSTQQPGTNYTVVVGGNLSLLNSSVAFGTVAYGGTYSAIGFPAYSGINSTSAVQSTSVVDFAQASTQLPALSSYYGALPTTDSAQVIGGILTLSTATTGLHVYNIAMYQLSSVSGIAVSAPVGATILINDLDSSLSFNNKSFTVNDVYNYDQTASAETAPHDFPSVLLNMPNATMVSIGGTQFQGSILAPRADATLGNDGSFWGTIVFKDILPLTLGDISAEPETNDRNLHQFTGCLPPPVLPTATPTNTATNTATAIPTNTPTNIPASTATTVATNTPTNTASATATASCQATNTATPTPTSWFFINTLYGSQCQPTSTPAVPTCTPSVTPSPTNTPTKTYVPPTNTPVSTSTPTRTTVPTNTPSSTPSSTNTPTQTATSTSTPTNTATSTSTPTLTATWSCVCVHPTSTPVCPPTNTPIPSATVPVAKAAPKKIMTIVRVKTIVKTVIHNVTKYRTIVVRPVSAVQGFQYTHLPMTGKSATAIYRRYPRLTAEAPAAGSVSIQSLGIQKAPLFSRAFVAMPDGSLEYDIAPQNRAITQFIYSAAIGARGLSVLFAHDDIRGSVFAPIAHTKKGAIVKISIHGQTYRYMVKGIHIVSPSDTSILDARYSSATLAMVTCTPTGIDTQRVIVIATLIK